MAEKDKPKVLKSEPKQVPAQVEIPVTQETRNLTREFVAGRLGEKRAAEVVK